MLSAIKQKKIDTRDGNFLKLKNVFTNFPSLASSNKKKFSFLNENF